MSSTLQRVGIVAALALVVSGTVHLVDAPDTFGDATYLGLSFLLQFAVTLVAATGILVSWVRIPAGSPITSLSVRYACFPSSACELPCR